ncbi:hypothetical protein [Inquilinus sp. OTU3971]|uniref:hypothetical protein n=1 Tax=Inquilinus sp. OTU3971 TaxID=3043855 RepID=UPI00313BACA4
MHIRVLILPGRDPVADLKAVRSALNIGLGPARALITGAQEVILTADQLNDLLVELPGRVQVAEPREKITDVRYDTVFPGAGHRLDDVMLTLTADRHAEEMVALRLGHLRTGRVRIAFDQAISFLGGLAIHSRPLPKIEPILNPKVIVAGPPRKITVRVSTSDGAAPRAAA